MTCKHPRIITFVTENGEPGGLWGCADCNVRFAPIADQIKAEQQRDELLAALSELVELKDLKDRIDTADLCTYDFDDAEAAQSLDDDYSRRKPLAWDAARAAIAKATPNA